MPKIESNFPAPQPIQPDQLKQHLGRLVTYAESIANHIASGSLEVATPAAQKVFLDKKANLAAKLSGILHRDILLRANRAYTLSPSGTNLKFRPVDVANLEIRANCMAVTSFEALELEWPGHVTPPIDEGLCLALDVGHAIDDVSQAQALYVPIARNDVEYGLQVNPQMVRRA
jgi:hypothetical protein